MSISRAINEKSRNASDIRDERVLLHCKCKCCYYKCKCCFSVSCRHRNPERSRGLGKKKERKLHEREHRTTREKLRRHGGLSLEDSACEKRRNASRDKLLRTWDESSPPNTMRFLPRGMSRVRRTRPYHGDMSTRDQQFQQHFFYIIYQQFIFTKHRTSNKMTWHCKWFKWYLIWWNFVDYIFRYITCDIVLNLKQSSIMYES